MRKKIEDKKHTTAYLNTLKSKLNFLDPEDLSQFDFCQDQYHIRISITVPLETWAKTEVIRPY